LDSIELGGINNIQRISHYNRKQIEQNTQNQVVMNLFKHIANLLALWTIPFIIVLFFMLVSGFAFTYSDCVSNTAFVFVYSIYYIMMFMMYVAGDEKDFDSIKLFKIN
jgi:hypothetical protein